ncbi:MAG: hypothetical protein AAF628_26390 [Planctomycetota bacterium]
MSDEIEAAPAEKKSSPAMEFVIGQLRRDPNIEYRVVKEAAAAEGLTLYPIVYGRAKALLGLVEVAPRGTAKKAAARRNSLAKIGGNHGRRPRSAGANDRSGSPLASLEAMIEDMRDVQDQRDRYRSALDEIARILDDI